MDGSNSIIQFPRCLRSLKVAGCLPILGYIAVDLVNYSLVLRLRRSTRHPPLDCWEPFVLVTPQPIPTNMLMGLKIPVFQDSKRKRRAIESSISAGKSQRSSDT